MNRKSIIIIGGGLAGLSAGCYARMSGYDVRIFEHAAIPGGVCTSWKKKNYLIDGCIHWLMGHRPGVTVYEVYKELGVTDAARFVDASSYINFVDGRTGRRFEITADFEKTKAGLEEIAPEDKKTIEAFFRGCKALGLLQVPTGGTAKPGGALGRLGSLWRQRKIALYFFMYNESLKDYVKGIKSAWVRDIIGNLFIEDMTTVFSMMLLGYFFNNQLGTVEGGSLRFVLPIAKKFKKLGGKMTFNATVEKVLVEDNAAVGVRLADGSEQRADVVISAADLHATLYDMLDDRYTGRRLASLFRDWPLFTPLMLVSFGVKGAIKRYPPVNVFFLKRPLTIGGKSIDRFMLRDYSYDRAMNPGDRTVIQGEIETDYDYWTGLRKKDEAAYYKEKDRVARMVLDSLEDFYPGIKAKVEMTDVATPYTYVRYTRNYRGAFEGWIMTGASLISPVPKTLPGLRNFYLAGQWVEPGGGVPTAVVSGRKCIKRVCRDDGRPFVTTA